MTGGDRDRKALDLLADALVEDILEAPDAEILAEFREAGGDPDRHAAEMRALFEKSVLTANKRRMEAAKAGAAASRRPIRPAAAPASLADARARLAAFMTSGNLPSGLTIAARKESDLSDDDVRGILEDLEELGFTPPDPEGDGRS